MTDPQAGCAIAAMAVLIAALTYASSYDARAVEKADAAYARTAEWCHAHEIGPKSPAYQACREAE